MEEIDPRTAYERMQQGLVPYVDVRTIEEYEAGHAQGAYNIPLHFRRDGQLVLNESFVADVRKRFAQEKPLILGCRTGSRSQKAAEMLEAAGFQALANDLGSFAGRPGILGWSADPELPTETGLPRDRAYS